MIEKQAEVKVLIAHLQMHLSANERKTGPQFQQEFFHMPEQRVFDGPLIGIISLG